jgi:D-methionine transport system ATP-binding protein
MIFQNFSLLSRLSVYDNIALPLRCWKYDAPYIDKRVRELLEILGIPEKIDSRPSELSGGQKQRVAIARALSTSPNILLCDEATSALDPQTTKSILSTLLRIKRDMGITVVVVTHEMPVIKSVCEEIAILENGNLEAVGSVAQILIEQPPSFKELTGERDIKLPETGTSLEIFFNGENAFVPVLTKMARELDIDFTIVWGDMAHYQDAALGSVIINIAEQENDRVYRYLDSNNIPWRHFHTNGKGNDE